MFFTFPVIRQRSTDSGKQGLVYVGKQHFLGLAACSRASILQLKLEVGSGSTLVLAYRPVNQEERNGMCDRLGNKTTRALAGTSIIRFTKYP